MTTAGEPLISTRDVTIRMNDHDVYTGPIRPSPIVMLEEAHRTRDFQRLFSAKIELPARGKPKFE